MINVCALSDYNFLAKGLTLYESLVSKTDSIVLHYLCLDSKSFEALSKYECESLKVYRDSDFSDETLQVLKQDDYKYYCYTLASYFTNYLMTSNVGDITYIDSDIYFYDDFNILLDEISDKEVGVFRHRQTPMHYNDGNGLFNVGVVHFKDTEIGRKPLAWWSDAVLYRKYPRLATCGDQKYLDAFLELPKDKLFIDGNIGHGAPWHWQLYGYSDFFKDNSIIWNGKNQKLLFSHFSEFSYNIKENSFICSTRHHMFTPLEMYMKVGALTAIHEDYFTNIKHVIKKYKLEG